MNIEQRLEALEHALRLWDLRGRKRRSEARGPLVNLSAPEHRFRVVLVQDGQVRYQWAGRTLWQAIRIYLMFDRGEAEIHFEEEGAFEKATRERRRAKKHRAGKRVQAKKSKGGA